MPIKNCVVILSQTKKDKTNNRRWWLFVFTFQRFCTELVFHILKTMFRNTSTPWQKPTGMQGKTRKTNWYLDQPILRKNGDIFRMQGFKSQAIA